MRATAVLALALLLGGTAATSRAQQALPGLTRDDLAKDNTLLLAVGRERVRWDEPTEPSKIVGPLYYVGTAGLGAFLFATSEGHILLEMVVKSHGAFNIART